MAETRTRVLVLGASGMLGHTMLRLFAATDACDAWGSLRSRASERLLPAQLREHIVSGVDAENSDALHQLFARVRPDVVINCIGVVKQLSQAEDPLTAIPINSLLPHRLAQLCQVAGARLIHISTDCVFSGAKGMYREDDFADAHDLYGRSKYLGEVDYPNAVTLRTSIIGPELGSAHGLLGWFLAQSGRVKGFSRAIFSGLPTVELARVTRDFVIPRPRMCGVYHVSSAPIDKCELLRLFARVYGVSTEIEPDERLVIDRSLDSTKFRGLTGYAPPEWPELVRAMHAFG